MMVLPARAPVAPRVLSASGAPILLEDEVRACFAEGISFLCVVGGRGMGKSVAMSHLASVLGRESGLTIWDDWSGYTGSAKLPIVAAASTRPTLAFLNGENALRVCELAPWTEDDWIEYLLHAHRSQCASIVRRMREAPDLEAFGGTPELCRAAMDAMAADESLTTMRAAIAAAVWSYVESRRTQVRVRRVCRDYLLFGEGPSLRAKWDDMFLSDSTQRLLRHAPVQIALSVKPLLRDLGRPRRLGSAMQFAGKRCAPPSELLAIAASHLRQNVSARQRVAAAFARADPELHAMYATVLLGADPEWRPADHGVYSFARADLQGVRWGGLDIPNARLSRAHLEGADLQAARLDGCSFRRAWMHRADLSRADLTGIDARFADLRGANLGRAQADGANFRSVKARGLRARRAELRGTRWDGASLQDADFTAADLRGARFDHANVDGANFSRACLDDARMIDVRLREAVLDGASFQGAVLQGVDLECVVLEAPDFAAAKLDLAWLTGSALPGANFKKATLREAELAYVQWPGADLSGADLTGASFKPGTTREGVHAGCKPAAWEHPPIYPDDNAAQDYLPPEAMRLANLSGVDLRGATLTGVDFYLVDLRGAQFDADQAVLLRESGAILENLE